MDDDRDLIDDALAVGAGFDFITPIASMIGNAITDRKHYSVPDYYCAHVDAAAHEANIRLHNRYIVDDEYKFDCTSDEWERIRLWLDW